MFFLWLQDKHFDKREFSTSLYDELIKTLFILPFIYVIVQDLHSSHRIKDSVLVVEPRTKNHAKKSFQLKLMYETDSLLF